MKRVLDLVVTPWRRLGFTGRSAVIGGPFVWLLLFFFVPFLLVVKISFADSRLGIPPYTELVAMKEGVLSIALDFSHYLFLFTDSLYFATYMNSLLVAAVSTVLCLLIGYPMAYYIARSNPEKRNLLMMAVMLPFWTSFLIRVYAWIGILKNNGLLNNFLMSIGLIQSPIELYHTNIAVHGVFVSAISRNAALRASRENGSDLARSGLRSRCETVEGFCADHFAAVEKRDYRGLSPRIHSGGRRIRDSGIARRRGYADDRPRDVERVLR
jgi:ABC-type Fe3+ transport system permease subunit